MENHGSRHDHVVPCGFIYSAFDCKALPYSYPQQGRRLGLACTNEVGLPHRMFLLRQLGQIIFRPCFDGANLTLKLYLHFAQIKSLVPMISPPSMSSAYFVNVNKCDLFSQGAVLPADNLAVRQNKLCSFYKHLQFY